MFSKDFERTPLAKMHRLMPNSLLANVCSYLFRLKHFFTRRITTPSAKLWLLEHMHQFVQQRLTETNNNKSTVDLLQLMIDAVDSEKVNNL